MFDSDDDCRTGCIVQIPFTGDSEKFAVIRRAVARTASALSLSQPTVALAMSYFFEEIAEGLIRGEVAAVPGFGAFFPSLVERDGRPPKPFVAFAANRPLANEMKLACPPERARDGKEKLGRHRKSHNPSNRAEKAHARVFTAQNAFRETIIRQSALVGDEED